ncbi:MAG TPA: histidinol dehydrogenase [Cyclobacteriaceae bacterium]|nr:histidinol dehydrogenase [Cyclobacteriaceae bacterium]HRJ82442.1 histidinol dehydrogenase [Cyclobacteriaceae bacterium]
MKLYTNPSRNTWPQLCERPQLQLEFLESSVKNILARVKKSGDFALKEFTKQYDQVEISTLHVTEEEIQRASRSLNPALKKAIETAASNIEKFHQAQLREVVVTETMPGVQCWRKGIAIEKVGIYIPGGTAPLFSTVLMLAIPARLAGCTEVILCSPPDKQGNIHPAILVAAQLTGVTKIFKAGGAQAIGALAYGTESIPNVYKIFGPGNQYVTKAKQLVNQDGVAIDMPAGPSEVLVWADETATPSFVAADLLSQAEHGADSQVILVLPNGSLLEKINDELKKQLSALPRKAVAEQALLNSRTIIIESETEALDFINTYAPEHLIVNTRNADGLSEKIINAGSVFIGNYTPEAAGDYASGTNHTLPTNGYAKAYAGVSVESFLKYITFQKISESGIKNIGPVVEVMAEAEELQAHKQAIRVRLDSIR